MSRRSGDHRSPSTHGEFNLTGSNLQASCREPDGVELLRTAVLRGTPPELLPCGSDEALLGWFG